MKTLVLADGVTQATTTLGPFLTGDSPGCFIQFSFSDAAAAGNVELEVSADGVSYAKDGTPVAVAAGATVFINTTTIAQYKRLLYTSTGGAGTMKVVVNIKEVYMG